VSITQHTLDVYPAKSGEKQLVSLCVEKEAGSPGWIPFYYPADIHSCFACELQTCLMLLILNKSPADLPANVVPMVPRLFAEQFKHLNTIADAAQALIGPDPRYKHHYEDAFRTAVIPGCVVARDSSEGELWSYHTGVLVWYTGLRAQITALLSKHCKDVVWDDLLQIMFTDFVAWYEDQLSDDVHGLLYQGFVHKDVADEVMYLAAVLSMPFSSMVKLKHNTTDTATGAFDYLMMSQNKGELTLAQWRLLIRPHYAMQQHVVANIIGWDKLTQRHVFIDRRPPLQHMLKTLLAALSPGHIADICRISDLHVLPGKHVCVDHRMVCSLDQSGQDQMKCEEQIASSATRKEADWIKKTLKRIWGVKTLPDRITGVNQIDVYKVKGSDMHITFVGERHVDYKDCHQCDAPQCTPFLDVIEHATIPALIVSEELESVWAYKTTNAADVKTTNPLSQLAFRSDPDFETFHDETPSNNDSSRYLHKLQFGNHSVIMADIRTFGYVQQSFVSKFFRFLFKDGYSQDEKAWALMVMEWLTEQREKTPYRFNPDKISPDRRRELAIEILAAIAYHTMKRTQDDRAGMYSIARRNVYKLWEKRDSDMREYVEQLHAIKGPESPFAIDNLRYLLFDISAYETIRRAIEDHKHKHVFMICGRIHAVQVEMLLHEQLIPLVRLKQTQLDTSCIVLGDTHE
jgi:hypothetical protein